MSKPLQKSAHQEKKRKGAKAVKGKGGRLSLSVKDKIKKGTASLGGKKKAPQGGIAFQGRGG